MAPIFAPEMIANPVTTLTSALLGAGAQKGGEIAAHRFGASPDTQRLVGDVTGATAGPLASKVVGGLVRLPAPAMAERSLGIRGLTHAYGATQEKPSSRKLPASARLLF